MTKPPASLAPVVALSPTRSEPTSSEPASNATETASFDDLWQLWPTSRRAGKLAAMKIWNEVTTTGRMTRTKEPDSGGYVQIQVPQTDPAEIYRGAVAELRIKQEDAEYPKYVKLLTTFLNRASWLDVDYERYEVLTADENKQRGDIERNQAQMRDYRRKMGIEA